MRFPFIRFGSKPEPTWEPGWCMVLGWTDRPTCPTGTCCAGRRRERGQASLLTVVLIVVVTLLVLAVFFGFKP
jgi:hypothetical protein